MHMRRLSEAGWERLTKRDRGPATPARGATNHRRRRRSRETEFASGAECFYFRPKPHGIRRRKDTQASSPATDASSSVVSWKSRSSCAKDPGLPGPEEALGAGINQMVLLSTTQAAASVATMPVWRNLDASSTTTLTTPAAAPEPPPPATACDEPRACGRAAQAGRRVSQPPSAVNAGLELSPRRAASSLACSIE